MDQTKVEELEGLLRDSLPHVVVRSRSGETTSTEEYRKLLQLGSFQVCSRGA